MKILHRDLKCANVFISSDENSVKLGDMNVSKVAKRDLVKTQTGKFSYYFLKLLRNTLLCKSRNLVRPTLWLEK